METRGRLRKDKEEIEARKRALGGPKITTLRNRLLNSSQKDFILVATQHPEEDELRKDRSASQFRDIWNSGIEIDPENEVGREEYQVSEMRDGAHLARGGNSKRWEVGQGSRVDYKSKEACRSCFYGEAIDLGAKYAFANMLKYGIEDTDEVNQTRLGAFKHQ